MRRIAPDFVAGVRCGVGLWRFVSWPVAVGLAAMAVGFAGCAKAPPDQNALMAFAQQDADAAMRQTGKAQQWFIGGEFVVSSNSPATVVFGVELRQPTGHDDPNFGVPVLLVTGHVYLVVKYEWTGSAWQRTSAEVVDQCPIPTPWPGF